jgi:hypothetical protein
MGMTDFMFEKIKQLFLSFSPREVKTIRETRGLKRAK